MGRLAHRTRMFALAAACIGFGNGAFAQATGNPGGPPANVTMSIEHGDIRSTLKTLFNSNHVNYTFDDSVTGTVTTSLQNVSFETALNTVLRNASTNKPLTYRVVNGIYAVAPREDEPIPEQNKVTIKLRIDQTSADAIVQQLKQLQPYRESANLTYQAIPVDNSIIVSGTEDKLRSLREGIRLLDVEPRQISVKAELILVSDKSSAKEKKNVVWSPMVRGVSGQEMSIHTEIGKSASAAWSSGFNKLNIKPRVNGDNSISLEADWVADLSVLVDGQPQPLHISHHASGTLHVFSGETSVLTSAVIKLGGKGPDSELLLFLTPTLVRERADGR